MTTEDIITHCKRILGALHSHTCDAHCSFHDQVRLHRCVDTCQPACPILRAKEKLMGEEAYYDRHPMAEVRAHCQAASTAHHCDQTCVYYIDVKLHMCKKRGKGRCPNPCEIAQAKQSAKRARHVIIVAVDDEGEEEEDEATIIEAFLDPDDEEEEEEYHAHEGPE